MPTQLDALPVEMVAHVALFLNRYRYLQQEDNGLLALRCVSRAGLDAVRRAIKNHPTNDVIFFSTSDGAQNHSRRESPRQRVPETRVPRNPTQPGPSPDKLNALRQFIVETEGACGSSRSTAHR